MAFRGDLLKPGPRLGEAKRTVPGGVVKLGGVDAASSVASPVVRERRDVSNPPTCFACPTVGCKGR